MAAAICAAELSRGRLRWKETYELSQAPDVAEGVDVYLISLSGMTSSNHYAASRLKGVADRIIAITSRPASPLGSIADGVIRVPYEIPGKIPGTLSFSLSLLLALKLDGSPFSLDYERALAEGPFSDIRVAGEGTTYFLANGPAFGLGLYAASKVSELLGARAVSLPIEEFGHATIFSLADSDAVNIFGLYDERGQGEKLSAGLAAQGFDSVVLRPTTSMNEIERLFAITFASQLATLAAAENAGLEFPYFVTAEGKLKLSDQMIY